MKDIIFTIYKYEIGKLPAIQLEMTELDPNKGKRLNPKDYSTKEEFFESFLPEKDRFLDLWEENRKSKKNEETLEREPHNNVIVEHRDNMIIVMVQANRSKTIYREDWSTEPEPNHPPFLIVFDNRAGHQLVAIQRAAMDTDKSAEMLQNSFNHFLNRYGFRFEVKRLKRELPFYEAIYNIKDTLHDRVSRVTFDFDKNQTESKKLNGTFIKSLKEWIGQFADSGQISANISDDEQLKNSNIKKDLELMAELCSSNSNYNLLVKFSRFGLFRFGQDVKAQFGMDGRVIEEFANVPKNPSIQGLLFDEEEEKAQISLSQWWDDVMKLYKDYEKEPLSDGKRKNGHRL